MTFFHLPKDLPSKVGVGPYMGNHFLPEEVSDATIERRCVYAQVVGWGFCRTGWYERRSLRTGFCFLQGSSSLPPAIRCYPLTCRRLFEDQHNAVHFLVMAIWAASFNDKVTTPEHFFVSCAAHPIHIVANVLL